MERTAAVWPEVEEPTMARDTDGLLGGRVERIKAIAEAFA